MAELAETLSVPLPPHDREAEASVLGACLIDPEAIAAIPRLEPADFYAPRNRDIFRAMRVLEAAGAAIDFVTVCDELERAGRMENAGEERYLSGLLMQTPTSAHVEHYAAIVARTAFHRRLISVAGMIAQVAYADGDIEVSVSESERLLREVTSQVHDAARGPVQAGAVVAEYLDGVHVGVASAGDTAVSTGFLDLDRLLGGLQPSDLIVLAARPAVGKTALAVNVGYRAAVERQARVLLFSVEMSRREIAQRLLSLGTGLDSARIREGRLSAADMASLVGVLDGLAEAQLWIDDTPAIGLSDLMSRARRHQADHGCDLVMVDHIQQVAGPRGSGGRVQEMAAITGGLKQLAREMLVPVLALSQLSRSIEQRPDHKPLLSDLRDGGTIEQDADVVIFMQKSTDEDRPGVVELTVAKHRNGPTGQVALLFQERSTRFVDLGGETSNGSAQPK